MEEEKKEQEKEKNMTEEKPSPKTEAGKVMLSGDPGRLRSRNFPGVGVSPGYTQKRRDLALLGVSAAEGKVLCFGRWDPKMGLGKAMNGQPRGERVGDSNETKGFFPCFRWSVG